MQFDNLFDDLDDEALTDLERDFAMLRPVHGEPETLLHGEEWREEPPLTNDLERCVHLAAPLITRYEDSSAAEWELSPLNWIRLVSSAHKRGKIGEDLFVAWAKSEGLDVIDRRHRGHDCVIRGLKIEVKTSLRWNNDRFVFFGLHPDFDFDAVALVAIEPHDVHLWIASKSVILLNARTQARGAEALGTKWLSFPATNAPRWLTPCGGSLADAFGALTELIADADRRPIADEPSASHIDDAALLELAGEIQWLWESDSLEDLEPTPPAPTTLHLIDTHQHEP